MFKIITLVVFVVALTFTVNAQFWKVTDPVKLDGAINSPADESMPVFSSDSSILYFTRTYDEANKGGLNDQDLWYSVKSTDGSFNEVKAVNNINNKFNNAAFGINEAGDRMYLLNAYSGKRDTEKGIAVAQKKDDGSWDKPEKLEIPNLDIEGDFYGFHVTPDEKVIIISYNGPNSVGEEDFYVTENNNGAWTSPVHMGSVINSTGYEIAPFLTENKDTLYFSSNGFGGQGDADIFYSVKQSSWTDWSTPENLGAPINTNGFDAYFVAYGKQIYWASNRGVEGENNDIYTSNVLSPPPFEAEVTPIAASEWGAADGCAEVNIISGVGPYEYEWSNGSTDEKPCNFAAGNYTVTITDALGRTVTAEITIEEPEKVEPPVVEEVATVEQVEGLILFELNSSYLNRKSRKVLDKLIVDLKGLNDVEIIIEAHTDARQTEKYNLWLSKRRMERTKEYLIEKGISADRITGRYKGEEELAVDCEECSEEDHQKNRRATIITKRKSSEM